MNTCQPCGRPRWYFWLWDFTWPSHGHCGDLRRGPADENLMLIPSLLFRFSKTLKLISTERSLTPDTHLQNVWTSLLHKHPLSHFYFVDPSLKDSYEKTTQRSSHFRKVYILFPWTVRLGLPGHLNKWKVPRNVKMKSYFPSILNTKFTIFQSDVWQNVAKSEFHGLYSGAFPRVTNNAIEFLDQHFCKLSFSEKSSRLHCDYGSRHSHFAAPAQ